MKKHEKWMPLYVGDYLASTNRLSLAEHGAYLLLIMDYWRNGAPPDNPVILARILGISLADWEGMAVALLKHFTVHGGRLHHARIELELKRAIETTENLSDRGKQGAKARWNNATANATANAQAMPDTMLVDAPLPLPCTSTTRSRSLTAPSHTKNMYKYKGGGR